MLTVLITVCFVLCFFFFFSSRRRHTRLTCDWSSDVCSSDLSSPASPLDVVDRPRGRRAREPAAHAVATHLPRMSTFLLEDVTQISRIGQLFLTSRGSAEAGRARGGRSIASVAARREAWTGSARTG